MRSSWLALQQIVNEAYEWSPKLKGSDGLLRTMQVNGVTQKNNFYFLLLEDEATDV